MANNKILLKVLHKNISLDIDSQDKRKGTRKLFNLEHHHISITNSVL